MGAGERVKNHRAENSEASPSQRKCSAPRTRSAPQQSAATSKNSVRNKKTAPIPNVQASSRIASNSIMRASPVCMCRSSSSNWIIYAFQYKFPKLSSTSSAAVMPGETKVTHCFPSALVGLPSPSVGARRNTSSPFTRSVTHMWSTFMNRAAPAGRARVKCPSSVMLRSSLLSKSVLGVNGFHGPPSSL